MILPHKLRKFISNSRILIISRLFIYDISTMPAPMTGSLSNFEAHDFIFDGVPCASMEGLLQSFKTADVTAQRRICSMVGLDAKRAGRQRNKRWRTEQTLFWKGVEYKRDSAEYQELLTAAFDALATNEYFRISLEATSPMILWHTIGSNNPKQTVLTEKEFIEQLYRLRHYITD